MTSETGSGTRDTPAAVRRRWARDRERFGTSAFLREPALYAVASYRFGQWLLAAGAPGPLQRAWRVVSKAIGAVVGVELPWEAEFGAGLRVQHGGAVVVHVDARVGEDCTLRQGVTLGERRRGGPVPVLGDRVEVGAHAQILGGVRVGDDAQIGALALVIHDVPAGGVALAPPAQVRAGRREADA